MIINVHSYVLINNSFVLDIYLVEWGILLQLSPSDKDHVTSSFTYSLTVVSL